MKPPERPSMPGLSDLCFGVGLAAGVALVQRVPVLAHDAPKHGVEALVVIPARNEAAVIGGLLEDLVGQRLLPARVVVVDDDSDDATAMVAATYPGVEVRPAGSTPPGWNPKSWAVHQGLAGATEAEIVLLDADVRLSTEALASVIAARRALGGWLSVAPRHDVVRAVETLSLPFNLVAVMGASGGRGAFGPCLAVSLDDYLSSGGHVAVCADLLDDIALAGLARAAGQPVAVLLGGDLVRYRMYPNSWRQLMEGWTKNIAAGATRVGPGRAALVALWVTASLVPLASAAAALAAGGRRGLAPTLARWLISSVATQILGRRIGRFPWWSGPAGPVLAAVFAAVFARSAVITLGRRPVSWKGRRLPMGARVTATMEHG